MKELFVVKNYMTWVMADKKRKNPNLPSIIQPHQIKEMYASEVVDGDQMVKCVTSSNGTVYFVIGKKSGDYLKV